MGIRKQAGRVIYSPGPGDGWAGALQRAAVPLALLYKGGASLRSFLYARGLLPSRSLPRPVISVGNLVAGGTGKTPLVIRIVEGLCSEGLRVAVLSRGYKGRANKPVNIVSDPDGVRLNAAEAGDEPYLMARELAGTPVLTGMDRFAVGEEAVRRFGVNALVLDDGFQHLSLRRECNLLLLDGRYPFGNGRCLPAGPLREAPSALRRANILVFSGEPEEEAVSGIRALAPGRSIHHVRFSAVGVRAEPFGSVEALSLLRGKKVLAFSGIARPERFYRSLKLAGVASCIQRSFPDHYPYSSKDVASLFQEGTEQGVDFLITTGKDRVRLSGLPPGPPLLSLVLSVEMDDEEGFFGEIRHCIGR